MVKVTQPTQPLVAKTFSIVPITFSFEPSFSKTTRVPIQCEE